MKIKITLTAEREFIINPNIDRIDDYIESVKNDPFIFIDDESCNLSVKGEIISE